MAIKPVKTSFVQRVKGALNYFSSGRDEFYAGGQADQRRFPNAKLNKDIADLISENRQRMMIGDGRYIYQAFSTVSGAVRQKADYVFGNSWRLQSMSKDSDFADKVEQDFKMIDRMLDIRGSGFSFRKSVWMLSKALDVDGDAFIVLTESDNGFPQLQFLEAHRVGSFENERAESVLEGRYKGSRIVNGVIMDDHMTPIAYRVKDDSRKGGYQDISASAIIHVSSFEWFSQARGIPAVTAGILDWYDLAETRDAQKMKQKVNSSLTLVESNETGRIDTGAMAVNPSGGRGGSLQTQLFDSGLIRYIKNGGKLTAHTANDPGQSWMDFTRLVELGAFYGMRWRREMFDGEQLARAGARGVVNDVNCSIRSRCEDIMPALQRAALYVIAKRAKMGAYDLPDDWYKVQFTKPAEFTVDEGRMRAADIADLRAGLTSEDLIVERRGMDLEELYRQRAKNISMKKRIAEEFGLEPIELGTLSMPGDAVPVDDPEQTEDDELDKKPIK